MLHPYNILKPIIYEALNEDEYIVECDDRILSEESIVELNTESVKDGKIIIPCFLKDVDASTFCICDAFGTDITTEISRIEGDSGWEDVSFGATIDNTDPLYSLIGSPVFVVHDIPAVLYNRTLTGTAQYDGTMLSNTYYDRLEYLYNSRFGSSRPSVEEVVVSFDQATGELVTDTTTRTLSFPLSVELDVDDVLPADVFIDKVIGISLQPPYVNVTIKKEYGYLQRLLSFDSNKLIILAD